MFGIIDLSKIVSRPAPSPLKRGTSSNIRHPLCNACRRRGSFQVLGRYFSDRTNAAGHKDPDVVIVGGGPAGLALATALGAYPFDIPDLLPATRELSSIHPAR